MSRRWVVLLFVAGALLVGGGVAWAFWTAPATPGSSGGGTAAEVPAAATPTVGRWADHAVQVSWPAVTLSNGVPAGGYVVRRYNATTGVVQTTGPGCSGTLATLSCTETGVPAGSWRWSVQGVIGANWTGAESARSATVTTSTATLTLAQTVFRGPFPVTTTGTLAGFGQNETVAYQLDTGTSLTGFPGVVDVTGGAPISSLSIPSAADGTHTVTATGGNGSVATTTITIDTTGPVVSSLQSPVGQNGWNTAPPVQVTLSAIDATTSVASIRYTTDGSDPTSSGTAQTYTGPFSVSSATTVRFFATDTAGNASAAGSRTIQFDPTPPANSVAVSSGALLSGGTVFYRGTAAGSFTLTNTVTDSLSGPASSATALGGTTTGFTHTPTTVSTPAGGPYVSSPVSWAAGTTAAPTVTVTGADVAGNTTATVLTLTNDSAPPTGGAVDATGLTAGRYSTTTAISAGFTKGTDAGVGLATSGARLQRISATLTNGACGSYGTATVLATDPASPYADTAPDQACHRYQYVVPDRLGNTVTYESGDVKVDTTAPAAPTFTYTAGTSTYASGQTLYYRGASASGSFTVAASSTDPASGIASYSYPAPLGTGWSGSAGSYSWSSANPAAPTNKTVTATNNAGLTASAVMTLVEDSVVPTGGSITYATGFRVRASQTLTLAPGTDAGSGIAANSGIVQRRTGTVASPGGACSITAATTWTTVATGLGTTWTDPNINASTCYEYQYSAADNLGNRSAWYAGPGQVAIPAYSTCTDALAATPPDGYWKLNETGSATAVDYSTKTNTGTYQGSYTQGVPGICGTSTYFDGSTAYVSTRNQVASPGPQVLSVETWFATTTTNGGKLVGFGDKQTGSSALYDRHLFMTKDGKINFGVTSPLLGLARYSATSTKAYNDGIWHHAVGTLSGAGLKLYIDGGAESITTTGTTAAQNYAGWWRLGGDSLAGWYPLLNGGSDYFAGQLSNAAVWNTYAMTPADAWNHFIAGWVATNPASAAAASIQSIPRPTRSLAPSRSPSPSPSRPPSPSPSPVPTTPSPMPSAPTSAPTTPPPSRTSPSPSANSSPTPSASGDPPLADVG
ncbi:LamG-like jellyroll fold domain-containing protein [Actinoplanes sp. RD1]|uniref:LamG-like jellyroll fold domain-containing protein n=1 Tax=Actinoplanes sp. RD1 TaxID=3064538 RepID=UPI0027413459|nr:LamG-like jellyroll fold domain-containing protein [Actinoplanes sp. RD1]